jgi:KaiC/GvpD/RAD55 family RecA-like ATPase
MTPKTLSILIEPTGHIVYPHTNEAEVAEAVCLFASAGIEKGEAVILIMAATHREPIRERLEQEGLNLKELERTGQLVCEEAESMLATVVFDGIVDEFRFTTKLGRMIQKAKTADGKRRSVRVFGEMVDLLWKSNPETTQRIEKLWSDVIEAHSVPLLCAYSLAGTKPGAFPESLRACHSHAIV